MIRHIFKIIWNERKTNAWITLEYVLVFCVLWFCVDYLFYMGKCYFERSGFDIENTYEINMQEKPANSAVYPAEDGQTEEQTGIGYDFSEPGKKLSGSGKRKFLKMGSTFRLVELYE